MNKKKLEERKTKFNELYENTGTSGVSNIDLAVMYNMYGFTDEMLEERKLINDSDTNKDIVSVSGYDMADMYDLLKNK